MNSTFVTILNVGAALLATILVLGPPLAVLWFSWRGLLTAAMVLAAIGLAFLTWYVWAATGGSSRQFPTLALLVCVLVGLGAGAFILIRNNVPIRVGATLIGIAALVWASIGFDAMTSAWTVAASGDNVWEGLLDRPTHSVEAMEQASADRTVETMLADLASQNASARESMTPAAVLPLRDLDGVVHDIALEPHRDIVTLSHIGAPTAKFLRLIHDPQMAPWLEGREIVAVIGHFRDSPLASEKGIVPMLFALDHQYHPLMTPGFYHAASGTFSTGVYRWMRDVLKIPQAQRDEIYLRHHDRLPD